MFTRAGGAFRGVYLAPYLGQLAVAIAEDLLSGHDERLAVGRGPGQVEGAGQHPALRP
jgi:hypothetical protein